MFTRKNVAEPKGLIYVENYDGTVYLVRQGESILASREDFEDESEETGRAARERAEQASSIRA